MIELKPYGEKAWRFINTPVKYDAPRTILSGSVRSSKTWTMMPKLLALCMPATCRDIGSPKGLKLITGVSKDSVYDNVLRDLFELVGPRAYKYNRQSGDLDLLGSQWKVIGAKDEGSEKYILGKTLAAAYCDEVVTMPEGFFRQLLNRLSVDGARLYGTTNPDSPYHYLYKDFINNKAINEDGSRLFRTLHFNLDDNPNISEEYKQSIRQSHTGVFYQRFVLGNWVVAEGLIYRDCWSEDANLYDDSTEPYWLQNREWVARYIGVDYGSVNPMVFLDFVDDNTTLWLRNEYYFDSSKEMRQKTDSEYADDFEKFVEEDHQLIAVVDPSAESFQLELRKRGFLVRDADNTVVEGIKATNTALAKKVIKVHRDNCPHWQEERSLYAWDDKACARGDEKPLKKNDHAMDATRYTVKTVIPAWRLLAA